jgi:hypothetical protein
MNSILQEKKECYKCKTTYDLHSHHIFSGTANRKLSEQYGLKIWLCSRHHNMSNAGIHFDRDFELEVKQMAQQKAMEHYGWSVEDFIRIYGKNWL